jgi:hypothetical protein
LPCPLSIAYCLLLIAHCLLPIAHCLLLIAYCLLLIAHCLLLIAHCLLLIAHCLLPIAYCLLPIAFCLLPIVTGAINFSSSLLICPGFPLQSFGRKLYKNLIIISGQKDFRYNPAARQLLVNNEHHEWFRVLYN